MLKRISKDVVGLVTYKAYRQVWQATVLRCRSLVGGAGHLLLPGPVTLAGEPLPPRERCSRCAGGTSGGTSLMRSSAGGRGSHPTGPPTPHGLTGAHSRICCSLSAQPAMYRRSGHSQNCSKISSIIMFVEAW